MCSLWHKVLFDTKDQLASMYRPDDQLRLRRQIGALLGPFLLWHDAYATSIVLSLSGSEEIRRALNPTLNFFSTDNSFIYQQTLNRIAFKMSSFPKALGALVLLAA